MPQDARRHRFATPQVVGCFAASLMTFLATAAGPPTPPGPTPAATPGTAAFVPNPCLTEEDIQLCKRIQGYFPTCAELRNRGVPSVRAVGSDLVMVVPNHQEDRFIVLGVGPSTSRGPALCWWGAGLADSIKEACESRR